jgi:hypothetical protein
LRRRGAAAGAGPPGSTPVRRRSGACTAAREEGEGRGRKRKEEEKGKRKREKRKGKGKKKKKKEKKGRKIKKREGKIGEEILEKSGKLLGKIGKGFAGFSPVFRASAHSPGRR